MVSFPVPDNERERLRELERLDFDAWGRSAVLDTICSVAASQLRTPMSLITILDESKQHFAGKIGFDADGTSREGAICAHAIMTAEPFIVADAASDPRFAEFPSVAGTPHVRAYAGIPLETGPGLRIGTLCAIDTRPRSFNEDEITLLSDLRDIAAWVIEAHRTRLDLDARLDEAADMEEELRRHSAELVRANTELGGFAAALSHDLKAPLRRIAVFLPQIVAAIEAGDTTEALEDYNVVRTSVGYMNELIDTLSGYCKLQGGDAPLTTVSMDRIVRDVLDVLAPAIRERNAKVTFAKLPDVKGNDPELMQLVQNLIGNALKYCEAAEPSVEIGATRQGAVWRLSIKDNGIGIEPSYQREIFEPFQRLHPASRYPGIGLGLAICKKVVDRHGGQIWCESEPGLGTVFHVTLPAAEA